MADKAQDVQNKVEYARNLHTNARELMTQWETLYKAEYSVRTDIADREPVSDTATVYKPAKARAIIQKFLALLAPEAAIPAQVLPQAETTSEERTCTNLENYLEGYQERQQYEARRMLYRHALQWALLRGKMVLQTAWRPALIKADGTYDNFPIRTIVPDPMTVYEVPGDTGLMYAVIESTRYAWEVRRDLVRRQQQDAVWTIPTKLSEEKDTDPVKVCEFVDGVNYSVLVDDEMVLEPKEHHFGFVPLSVAYMEDTPFPEREWAGQSVLAPIMDALKWQAALLSRLNDAAELYFYPLAYWITPDGRAGLVTTNPASWQNIPPDAKFNVVNPQPNIPILEKLYQWLQSDINIYSLPEIAYGVDMPSSSNSGFAISQVLGQMMDRVKDKKTNLELGLSWHFEQVLRLTEQFCDRVQGNQFDVVVRADERGKLKSKRALLKIGKEEVNGHYRNRPRITPQLPSDRTAEINEVNMLLMPDPKTGLAKIDRQTAYEMFPNLFAHPDEIQQRLDEERYAREVPEIANYEKEKFMREWRKRNKPLPAENAAGLPKLNQDQVMQLVQVIMQAQGNPQALMQIMQGMGQPSAPPQVGAPMGGAMDGGVPGAGGPMLPSNVLPPAMQSGQANPNPNPQDALIQQLMQRGAPQ